MLNHEKHFAPVFFRFTLTGSSPKTNQLISRTQKTPVANFTPLNASKNELSQQKVIVAHCWVRGESAGAAMTAIKSGFPKITIFSPAINFSLKSLYTLYGNKIPHQMKIQQSIHHSIELQKLSQKKETTTRLARRKFRITTEWASVVEKKIPKNVLLQITTEN